MFKKTIIMENIELIKKHIAEYHSTSGELYRDLYKTYYSGRLVGENDIVLYALLLIDDTIKNMRWTLIAYHPDEYQMIYTDYKFHPDFPYENVEGIPRFIKLTK